LVKSLFFIPFTKGSGLIQPLLFIGWSFNYEMFFYLALALGLLLHKRLGVWMGAVIVLLPPCWPALPFAAQNVFAQFYSRDISLEFLLGILSYYVCRAVSDAQARKLRVPALDICMASAAMLIVHAGNPDQSLPFHTTRVPSLGVLSFLLVTSASLLSQAGWDTKLASLVLIGDASYILYLIHPYCEYSLDRFFGSRHPLAQERHSDRRADRRHPLHRPRHPAASLRRTTHRPLPQSQLRRQAQIHRIRPARLKAMFPKKNRNASPSRTGNPGSRVPNAEIDSRQIDPRRTEFVTQ
jgi:hypothetical protein